MKEITEASASVGLLLATAVRVVAGRQLHLCFPLFDRHFLMSNQKSLFRGLDLVSDSVFACVTPALHVPCQ